MQRERVAESIYVFTSERYLDVTAGVVITPLGCVVIDTLPFPSESRQLRDFAMRLCRQGIRYVINTRYRADHTNGNCFFAGVPIVAHEDTRKLLDRVGEEALQRAKAENPELAEVTLRLPDITYREKADIHLGPLTLELIHAPGNSPDGTIVFINEEKVLFTGDAMLPVPYIVGGDPDELQETLERIRRLSPETIVQGHGEVLLRGEIPETIDLAQKYLRNLQKHVGNAVRKGLNSRELARWDIEKAGLSRVPLGGMANSLHRANVLYLYKVLTGQAKPDKA